MILKSLYIASIFFSLTGFGSMSARFDAAISRVEQGSVSKVEAHSQLISDLPAIEARPKIVSSGTLPNVLAEDYLLADLDSATILLKQNMNAQVPIASTTKIMTALIALENYKLKDIVTISEKAAFQEGADAYLIVDEKITVGELLHCLLIKSGNDSAYALAEHMNDNANNDVDSDKTKLFVAKMNEKAKELGMKNTHYMDPAGLDTTGYSSAYDLFLVTREALKQPTFREIVKTKEYTAKSVDGKQFHALNNSNRLVNEYDYPGAIGVKTGYMPEAGHCLVSAVERDGHTLIGVILNTTYDTAPASADESKKLLDFGFANTEWQN